MVRGPSMWERNASMLALLLPWLTWDEHPAEPGVAAASGAGTGVQGGELADERAPSLISRRSFGTADIRARVLRQWSIVLFSLADDGRLAGEGLRQLEEQARAEQARALLEALVQALRVSFKLLCAPKKARVLRRYLVMALRRLVPLAPGLGAVRSRRSRLATRCCGTPAAVTRGVELRIRDCAWQGEAFGPAANLHHLVRDCMVRISRCELVWACPWPRAGGLQKAGCVRLIDWEARLRCGAGLQARGGTGDAGGAVPRPRGPGPPPAARAVALAFGELREHPDGPRRRAGSMQHAGCRPGGIAAASAAATSSGGRLRARRGDCRSAERKSLRGGGRHAAASKLEQRTCTMPPPCVIELAACLRRTH
eukprot:scaffold15_cov354-Prasinococcus_capsulatus_cf.AAC.6